MAEGTNLTGRIGRWSAERPWRSIGLWLTFVFVALVAGSALGSVKLTDARSGSGEAGRAEVVIDKAFTLHATEQILLHSSTLTVGTAGFRAAVDDVVSRVRATHIVLNMRSPLDPANPGQISRDRHSALVQFDVTGKSDTADTRVAPIQRAVALSAQAHSAVQMSESGDASLNKAFNDTVANDLRNAERLSMPITLFVLLFTFGALVAALLPLALAVTAILGASGLLAFTSHLTPLSTPSSSVLLLIGLAVGVDYSLFYVKRARQERAAGHPTDAALLTAAATSGRSVLISGITVLIAMSGMFLSGSPTFYGVTWAAILVVAVAVIGSLTVLPAMLSLLGDRVNWGRIPLLSRVRHAEQDSRVWRYVLDRTLRHPVVAAAVSAGALVALAIPVLGMHTATPGANDLPQSLPALQIYNQIQRTFPGGPNPALVVVQAKDVTAGPVEGGIESLRRTALGTGQMNEPIFERVSADRGTAVVSIPLAGTGEDAVSVRALQTLRSKVIPATIAKAPHTAVAVTGFTAGTTDFNALMRQRIPIVFAFVLLLALVLLLFSFRSLVIALTAIVLTLLSVAAAYGVLVLIFQDGHGQSLLRFKSVHAITSWLPLFLFVVLFGLSMDYHVFILSRIREAFDKGASTTDAVSYGIRSTAGTVTAAAIVMVFVFLTFATLSQISFKELGVGLATAVLLDATIVRGVLLPAVMRLLGDRNWYLPSWLEWLPRTHAGGIRGHTGSPVRGPVANLGAARDDAGGNGRAIRPKVAP
jgi:uncharacterized membrane protein YdfJ with MMPL/SSD domain